MPSFSHVTDVCAYDLAVRASGDGAGRVLTIRDKISPDTATERRLGMGVDQWNGSTKQGGGEFIAPPPCCYSASRRSSGEGLAQRRARPDSARSSDQAPLPRRMTASEIAITSR